MVSVCIMGVYFGALPQYFNLWVKTAKYNSTIDFMVFTDQEYDNLPDNIHFIDMTIGKMKQLADTKLGFPVNLKRPYKCCDFKPAYGVIFEEYISSYDYWGHCDFDLIWGDIRGFLDKYDLQSYDKFLSLGHLSLYRNNYENNRRFMLEGSLVGDYRTVYQDEHNFAFDEFDGVYQIFKKNSFKMFEERIFADISKIYKRFRLSLNDTNYDNQVFFWENGHVFRVYIDNDILCRDEFIYIHFKERKDMDVHDDVGAPDVPFLITYTGFWKPTNLIIGKQEIEKFNPFFSKRAEKKELALYNRKDTVVRYRKKINSLFHIKESIR